MIARAACSQLKCYYHHAKIQFRSSRRSVISDSFCKFSLTPESVVH